MENTVKENIEDFIPAIVCPKCSECIPAYWQSAFNDQWCPKCLYGHPRRKEFKGKGQYE